MRTNFQMENQNITMVAGNTIAFNVEIFDEDGNAITVEQHDQRALRYIHDRIQYPRYLVPKGSV